MMLASIYGRLGQEPRSVVTKSGNPMCVSSMAVELVDKNGEAHTQWFGLVAFGRVADSLIDHSKGELVSAGGRVQMNSWATSGKEKKSELQLIVDSLVSARTARPGRKRGQSSPASENAQGDSSEQSGFDDDIPF